MKGLNRQYAPSRCCQCLVVHIQHSFPECLLCAPLHWGQYRCLRVTSLRNLSLAVFQEGGDQGDPAPKVILLPDREASREPLWPWQALEAGRTQKRMTVASKRPGPFFELWEGLGWSWERCALLYIPDIPRLMPPAHPPLLCTPIDADLTPKGRNCRCDQGTEHGD